MTSVEPHIRSSRVGGVEVCHDPAADALTIRLAAGERYFAAELDEDRFLHYSRDGVILAVEVLGVSGGVDLEGVPRPEEVAEAPQRLSVPPHRPHPVAVGHV